MPSPQFRKRPQFRKSTRPLRPASYRAAVRRFRKLCDLIEQYSDPQDIREKAQLTRAIHGLAYGAKDFSARHRRATAAIQSTDARDGNE